MSNSSRGIKLGFVWKWTDGLRARGARQPGRQVGGGARAGGRAAAAVSKSVASGSTLLCGGVGDVMANLLVKGKIRIRDAIVFKML